MFELLLERDCVAPETGVDVDALLAAAERAPSVEPNLLDRLQELHLPSLTAEQRVRLLEVWRRGVRFMESQLVQVIAAVAGPAPTSSDDWAREEVALAMQWSPSEGGRQVHAARDMAGGRLPMTWQLLASGEVSLQHALAVADVTARLSDELARAVDLQVSWRAPEQSVGELRAAVRRAVIAVEGLAADERHQAAVEQRSLDVVPAEDGVAEIVASNVSADDAQTVFRACDSIARDWRARGDDRGRTLRQLRADALVEMARRQLADSLQTAHGRPILLHVHVTLDTLLGVADDPGHLDGYGALPPHLARELARDAKAWRHVLTDGEQGVVLDVGHIYTPTQALRDRVLARYETCSLPGCNLPAYRCDLDHNVAHPDGPTCDCNVSPLCRRHHRMRHETPWRVVHRDDHVVVWISPTNRIYLKRPRSLAPPPAGDRTTPLPSHCPHDSHRRQGERAEPGRALVNPTHAERAERLKGFRRVEWCPEHAPDLDADPPF